MYISHQKVGIKEKNNEADFDDASPGIVLHVAVALRPSYAKGGNAFVAEKSSAQSPSQSARPVLT